MKNERLSSLAIHHETGKDKKIMRDGIFKAESPAFVRASWVRVEDDAAFDDANMGSGQSRNA